MEGMNWTPGATPRGSPPHGICVLGGIGRGTDIDFYFFSWESIMMTHYVNQGFRYVCSFANAEVVFQNFRRVLWTLRVPMETFLKGFC